MAQSGLSCGSSIRVRPTPSLELFNPLKLLSPFDLAKEMTGLDLIAALVKKSGHGSKRRNSDLDLSDEDEEEEEFLLGAVLKDWKEPRGSAEAIDSSWFAASKRLAGLHKGGRKAHRKVFLATSGLEDWHPSWLGHGQP